MNPMNSKKFLTLLLDTAVSIGLYFWKGADAQFLIMALQPVFVALIAAYATQEVMALKLMSKLDARQLAAIADSVLED